VRLTVRAPATVANLGAGFDCLGLALDLWNVFALDLDARPGVEVIGHGVSELAEPNANLVLRAVDLAFREEGRSPDPFRLTCHNDVPLRRGLGSSASAVVGGLLLADALLGRERGYGEILAAGAAIEGHADNLAACLLGGVTVAYRTGAGWHAERLSIRDHLRAVVLVPEDLSVSTQEARLALPDAVRLEDATFNVSRSILTVLALSGRPELLADALDDRLHQAKRLAMAPEAAQLFERLRGTGFPVCVAGSGPSLLVFPRHDGGLPAAEPGWSAVEAAIARVGASLSVG
jgi:homoserine kinase